MQRKERGEECSSTMNQPEEHNFSLRDRVQNTDVDSREQSAAQDLPEQPAGCIEAVRSNFSQAPIRMRRQ